MTFAEFFEKRFVGALNCPTPEMVALLEAAYEAGHEAGYSEGRDDGYDAGYDTAYSLHGGAEGYDLR